MSIKTYLMLGGSGMAGSWIRNWTENFADRVKIIGVVDVNQEVLDQQGAALGLSANQLFTNYNEACATVKADFCGIATPPQFHSQQAIAAMDNGMPVLCEKPIADTLEAAKAIAHKAQETGLPCGIIQNYRYAANKQELVRIRDEGRLGRLQHIFGRYACDYRNYTSWGKAWRHDMDFGLLFEGSVHHFDMLRFLSGGDCDTLMGFGWNPEWSSFKHFSSGYYLMRMDNGVHTAYEGNSSAGGITSCWHKEYYRAEFEEGSVEVGEGDTMTITQAGQEPNIYEAPPVARYGHEHLLDEFLNWLDGGPASQTQISDNLKSYAMVIAAMETTLDGQPKRIADYLEL
jgi:predicted dehydrogenase